MTEEKRRHGRAPLVMEASWEGSGIKSHARTTDISATGCFIDSMSQVRMGDTLHLELKPPKGQAISVQVEVVYCQRVGFGVRFKAMSDSDRRRLEMLLNQYR